ncbi:hypothetical protein M0Q50_09515 [bacterium]|jgi:hypothetical protein|nr:hypothetical protein [bacterium]
MKYLKIYENNITKYEKMFSDLIENSEIIFDFFDEPDYFTYSYKYDDINKHSDDYSIDYIVAINKRLKKCIVSNTTIRNFTIENCGTYDLLVIVKKYFNILDYNVF